MLVALLFPVLTSAALAGPVSYSTTMTVDHAASTSGEFTTLKITVLPDDALAPTPTGTVTITAQDFAEQGVTENLDASGVATFTVRMWNDSCCAGTTTTINANYVADSPFQASVLQFTHFIDAAEIKTEISLGASDATPAVGQTVTYTATVTATTPENTFGLPAGKVRFYIPGDPLVELGTVEMANGTASVNYTLPDISFLQINAEYHPYDHFNSDDTLSTWSVGKSDSTTLVSFSDNPAIGGVATAIATVSGSAGTPTGTVIFTYGSFTSAPIALVGGVASLPLLIDADTSVAATYSGDTTYVASSDSDLLKVSLTTSTTLAASPGSPSAAGGDVTFTATVAPTAGDAKPTGSVEFSVDGTAQSPTIALADGLAAFSASLAPGDHVIGASYTPDVPAFAGSAAITLSHTVAPFSTAVALVSSVSHTLPGDAVTFTATVTSGADGMTVNFYDDAMSIGSDTLSGGVATFETTTLALGTHTITARLVADAAHTEATSNAVGHLVEKGAANIAVTSSPNPSDLHQSVTIVATLTGVGDDKPTGTVDIILDLVSGGEGTPLASNIAIVDGVATFSTTMIPLGMHTLAVRYSGDARYLTFTSVPVGHEVGVPEASTNLRAMQVLTTRLIALNSGQAFVNAIKGSIYNGFAAGNGPIQFGPGGLGLNYAAPFGAGIPWPEDAGAVPAGPLQIWADVTANGVGEWGDGFDSDTLSGLQANALAGLAYKITPEIMVGLTGGYETFAYRSDTLSADLSGDGWTTGGYVGGQFGETLRFFAAGGYTALNYDVASGGTTASFGADRYVGAAGLVGDFDAYGFSLEPSLTVFGLWEHQDGYTDSASIAQPERDFATGRASAGLRVGYTVAAERFDLLPYAGLYADYSAEGDVPGFEALALGGVSGRLTGGVAAQFDGGATLGLGGQLGGLFAPLQDWSLDASLTLPF